MMSSFPVHKYNIIISLYTHNNVLTYIYIIYMFAYVDIIIIIIEVFVLSVDSEMHKSFNHYVVSKSL